MTEQTNKKGRAPDFKGEGVAVWVNKSISGKIYMNIVVLDSIKLTAWKYEAKKEETVEEILIS